MSILDLTWGVALAFAIFSTVLSGILTVQVCVYSAKFPHDSLFVKCTVWTVFILEILHNSFTWRLLHHYLVASYSNFSKLALVEWGITPAVIFQATVTCVVQLFYVRRCWLVNRKHWVIPMITAFLSFSSFSAGCYAAVAAIRTKKYAKFRKNTPVEPIWIGAGGLADILIFYCIISSIRGSRMGYKPIDKGLRMLGVYAFSTGAVTTILNFLTMCMYYLESKSLWHIGLSFVLSRSYSISLMASLHLRGAWTKDPETEYISGTARNPWFKSKDDGTDPISKDSTGGTNLSGGSVIEIRRMSPTEYANS